MQELQSLGVNLSIDDFGTGYSSLAALKSFPVTRLKIDKSFITNLCEDRRAEAIVRSTIDLSRHLDLKVVAEGIETEAVLERLTALDCDTGQGYFISRPVPAEQLTERLMADLRLVTSNGPPAGPGRSRSAPRQARAPVAAPRRS